jgi:AcrR family transcriptional regulator
VPKVSGAHLEQRRQQILQAAITCFARKGFHQTTMAEIAAEAGVSDTLAYRYFSGKEALTEAAVREYGGTSIDELIGGSDGTELRAVLGMLLDTNIRRFDRPGEMQTTMAMYLRTWAEALHDENVREGVLSHWRHHFDVIEGLVSRAQTMGEVARELDPRAIAWTMLAIHYGLNLLAVLDREIDPQRTKEVAFAMFRGLGADAAAGTTSDGSARGDGER